MVLLARRPGVAHLVDHVPAGTLPLTRPISGAGGPSTNEDAHDVLMREARYYAYGLPAAQRDLARAAGFVRSARAHGPLSPALEREALRIEERASHA